MEVSGPGEGEEGLAPAGESEHGRSAATSLDLGRPTFATSYRNSELNVGGGEPGMGDATKKIVGVAAGESTGERSGEQSVDQQGHDLIWQMAAMGGDATNNGDVDEDAVRSAEMKNNDFQRHDVVEDMEQASRDGVERGNTVLGGSMMKTGDISQVQLQQNIQKHTDSRNEGTEIISEFGVGNLGTYPPANACSSLTEVMTTLTYRKRKRGREGPDACESSLEHSAIRQALESSSSRPGEPIFFPYEGTKFRSCDEAREFYNLYSWEVGFGIRMSKEKANKNNYTTRKDMIWSCEGFCKNPRAASARTGCKAMMRLHRTADHSWVVTKIIADHNHALSETYGEKKQWGSHGGIDATTKEFIRKLKSNNVPLGRVCSILGVSSADRVLPIRKQAVRNLCTKISQDTIKEDMRKTMEILNKMSSEDRAMKVRFRKDDEGRITSMLWCTGKNQIDYKHFGDVVTFDTTYRTNLYNLPFGIFIGVNNHFQSIIFGGVLLSHETTEDFEWAFSNFLQIMGDKHPATILTDQCQGMAAAIKTTMPHTRHRWCRWHVLRKAKQKIGPLYSKKSTFKKKFNNLVTYEISPSAFEQKWRELVEEYQLSKNKFMDRAFKFRGMWAKPYFMDIFCAGMTSTQRSESANHMLKRFIQRSAPMHVFVAKFRDFQFDRNQEEERENHITKQVSRRRRIGVPIEEHAEDVYTRGMYERFCNELFKSGGYIIKDKSDNNNMFMVAHNKKADCDDCRIYKVWFEGKEKVNCSCSLYEHLGMLCRHTLKVLVHRDITKIPQGNIKGRWTKLAGAQGETVTPAEIAEHAARQNDEMKRRVIVMRAMQLAQEEGSIDDADYTNAISALDSVKITKREVKARSLDKELMLDTFGVADESCLPTQCPPRVKRAGRPQSTTLKAWQRSEKENKKSDSTPDATIKKATPRSQGSVPLKTRMITDLMHVT